MKNIFVFGSNTAGAHGAGAARTAVEKFGAILGKGWGIQGNSYAIPTKDDRIQTLPVEDVARHVNTFLEFAAARPTWNFYVTKIGTGLASLPHESMASLFKNAPENCIFDREWEEFLGNNYTYFEGFL